MNMNIQSLKDLLSHPEFLEGEHWRKAHYNANNLVIVEGEVNKDIFVVLQGALMVCTDVELSENRHMLSGLCELFDGEEFAQSCFFDDEPHCATVKTLTESDLAVIDAGKLKLFLNQHPDIGYQILYHWIEQLLPRFRKSNKRISSLFSWGLKAHKIDQEM
jgi:CRP/FNR family transcriptional regulator, cyclic AMP receptor protein